MRPVHTSLASEAAPGHVVEFKGKVPANFAAQVAALGGTVELVHEGVGFAKVSGLTAEAAAQLGKKGLGDVYEDVAVQLAVEPQLGSVELLAAPWRKRAVC